MAIANQHGVARLIALTPLLLGLLACDKSASKPVVEAERKAQTDLAEQDALTGPSPKLTPEQVVKMQLESIRDSNGTEDGLAAAYRFNSPDHKQRMGTSMRFAAIMRSSEFQTMLGFRAAQFGATRIEGERARQIVTLEDDQGRVQIFLFELRRQESGPDKGCWLTDAVYPSSMNMTLPNDETGNPS